MKSLDTSFSETMKRMMGVMENLTSDYNDQVMRIFSNYAATFFKGIQDESIVKDDYLPHSGVDFQRDEPSGPVIDQLKQCMSENNSISSFAGLSGNREGHYHNDEHFLSTLKHTIYLNKSHFPFANLGSDGALNSFQQSSTTVDHAQYFRQ